MILLLRRCSMPSGILIVFKWGLFSLREKQGGFQNLDAPGF
jgi:hypothetical protein